MNEHLSSFNYTTLIVFTEQSQFHTDAKASKLQHAKKTTIIHIKYDTMPSFNIHTEVLV